MFPASHSPTPHQIRQESEAKRPGNDEAQHQQPEPSRFSEFIQSRQHAHDQLRVDVRNINISDEPPLSTSIASTLLGISAEAEPAQVNENCSFEQIFWRHRQCPAAGLC